MVSCRIRKTGNCSDCPQNRLLQEKNSETFPGSFHIPGSPALCVGRGGVASTHGDREAPAWHRRGRPFFRLWMRLPDRDDTEDGRALNDIVVLLESQQKRACHPGVFPAMSCAVLSLIRWPGFRLCERHGLAHPILLESGASRRLLLLIGRLFAGKCRSRVSAAPNGFSAQSFSDFSQSRSCLIHDS